MTTLYILRHAHAGDASRWTGDDAARPLSDKGRRQSERVAGVLQATGEAPDLVVTSPMARAAETAGIVAGILGIPVVEDPRLVGPLYAQVVEDVLEAAGHAERPCIVGHDPDFSSLLGDLTGIPIIPMRKGAVARVDFEGRIRSGRGILRFLVPPELIAGR